MDQDSLITLVILIVATVLFITEWVRVDITALGVVIALALFEIVTPSEAVSGFSNTAVISIIGLFVVGGAIAQTGLDKTLGENILKIAGKDELRLVGVVMLTSAGLSSFMSNTGTVAVLLPAVIGLARSAKVSASKLMIPLAFGSSLGGAMTLIGTPPNILVSEALEKEGLKAFSFFAYTPIGVILLVGGMIFMLTIGRRLLPDNKPTQKKVDMETPEELLQLYKLPDNIFRLRVRDQSTLRNKTLGDSNFGENYKLTILEVLRPVTPTTVLKVGSQRLTLATDRVESIHPNAELELLHNDVLLVRGDEAEVKRALAECHLSWQPVTLKDQEYLINQEGGIAEILIRMRSKYLGKTLREIRFGSRYKLTVLDIIRGEAKEKLATADTPLEGGDILLVQGLWKDILAMRDEGREFVVMGQPEDMMGAPNRDKAPYALLIMLLLLVLIVSEIIPLVVASLLAAVAMVLVGCLSMDDAYDSIEWGSVVLIAGMLPMATALERVGLVKDVSLGIVDVTGEAGPLVVLGAIFLLTAFFTQLLSNTTTAVLMAPIAIAIAKELDVHPQPFLMGVAIAASMAFATPVGSPVNALVMGAGRYKFADFLKVGIPLMLITLVLAMIFLPIFFPF